MSEEDLIINNYSVIDVCVHHEYNEYNEYNVDSEACGKLNVYFINSYWYLCPYEYTVMDVSRDKP